MDKSQISMEYAMIIGFAALMTLPLLLVYYTHLSSTSDSVSTSQALQIARKIVDSSESVYYLGKPSQTTLKVNFPDNIYLVNITGKEVVFKMKIQDGVTDVVQVSSVNLSGNLPKTQGIHLITIKADDGYVIVTSN